MSFYESVDVTWNLFAYLRVSAAFSKKKSCFAALHRSKNQ